MGMRMYVCSQMHQCYTIRAHRFTPRLVGFVHGCRSIQLSPEALWCATTDNVPWESKMTREVPGLLQLQTSFVMPGYTDIK